MRTKKGEKMENSREKSKIQLLNMCSNIKFLREKHCLTKKEMAKRLKISTRSLSMLEEGIVPPNLSCEILFRIQYEFDISPSDLLKGRINEG